MVFFAHIVKLNSYGEKQKLCFNYKTPKNTTFLCIISSFKKHGSTKINAKPSSKLAPTRGTS